MKLPSVFFVALTTALITSSCGSSPQIEVDPSYIVPTFTESPKKLNIPRIKAISKDITVLIKGRKSGSGVIIKQYGNTYYVLTTKSIVEQQDKYEIVTSDKKTHKINYNHVKKIPNLDLAIITFNTDKNYLTAQLGDSKSLSKEERIYLAGYNLPGTAIDKPRHLFSLGTLISNKLKKNGYTLSYKSFDLPGMNGGAILNKYGHLVGIHGKKGLGTPIQILLNSPTKFGINLNLQLAHSNKYSNKPLTLIWSKKVENKCGNNILFDRKNNFYHFSCRELFKYKSNGNLLWKRRQKYDFSANSFIDNFDNIYGLGKNVLYKYDYNGFWIWKFVWKNNLNFSSFTVDNASNIYGIFSNKNSKSTDYLLAKYNSNNSSAWKRQLTDTGLIGVDKSENIYITGSKKNSIADQNHINYNIWLTKYDKNGNFVWKRELGTSKDDFSKSIVLDSFGNIYIAGNTLGSLGNVNILHGYYDTWLAKYNPDGFLLWKKQIGSTDKKTSGINVNHNFDNLTIDKKNNIYISTNTSYYLPDSSTDVIKIIKYNNGGKLLWKQKWEKFRPNGNNSFHSAFIDKSGNVYIYQSGLLRTPKFGWTALITKYSQK